MHIKYKGSGCPNFNDNITTVFFEVEGHPYQYYRTADI